MHKSLCSTQRQAGFYSHLHQKINLNSLTTSLFKNPWDLKLPTEILHSCKIHGEENIKGTSWDWLLWKTIYQQASSQAYQAHLLKLQKQAFFLLRSLEILENLVGFIPILSNCNLFRENACDWGMKQNRGSRTYMKIVQSWFSFFEGQRH